MTEEELKTLCKSLESRYGENSTITVKQSDFNNMWASIDRYAKENKCLQEQLAEANEVIKDYDGFTSELTTDGKYACKYANSAHLYLEKWGVK